MLSSKNVKAKYKDVLEALEAIIDKGDGNVEVVNKRMKVVNTLQKVDKFCSSEMAQKAKVKWSIEGDENTSFFHGMLNKKPSLPNIRSFMVDGMWIESPNRVELESDVSNEETKRAVWDCGIDKSPGPDGFTFGFYRRFWNLIENDVYDAVNYFFTYGVIPKGCNSSFIALILKIPDANTVNDFRPISLIESLYKIVAKILANSLVGVLGDIVNEVQSAFIAGRQILDDPFILNEELQWCKIKKKQSLIFNVDFEKAYDFVRWDFLDDILKKIGFGEKWCKWIQSCLRSSRCSIIINGSPTKEFHFFKGLKQGGPLSPFLFILIMKSLHLSFQRAVIKLSSSLSISHMFYADDVFLLVNGAMSKVMGVLVDSDKVKCAASKLGCFILKTPFSYLGSKVGGYISRVHTWNEVVDRVKNRLFKWKMKTLSIGVSKKASWVNWKKVLAPKEKGGLGVSSLYALNRGNGDKIAFWEDIWIEDRWIWALKSSGDFSVASVRKVKTDSLPTRFNVSRRGIHIDSIMCAICDKGEETSSHLFFSCCMARQTVRMITRWWDVPYGEVDSYEDWINFSVKSARVAIDKKLLITGMNVTRWNKLVPIKVNILGWRLSIDKLPTRVNLDARGIDVPSVVGYSYFRDEMLSTIVRLVLGSSVKYGAKTVFGGNVIVDRETAARVDLINSQKVAEDLKILQIDKRMMDPVDATIINAQKARIWALYQPQN
nr:RNA-directed DNA polymerase, eukaryota, reverse transcriptase zinc-binding domain protein [Tanacetum cinerariifolium]